MKDRTNTASKGPRLAGYSRSVVEGTLDNGRWSNSRWAQRAGLFGTHDIANLNTPASSQVDQINQLTQGCQVPFKVLHRNLRIV